MISQSFITTQDNEKWPIDKISQALFSWDVRNCWTEGKNWKENKIMVNFKMSKCLNIFENYMTMFCGFYISEHKSGTNLWLLKLCKWYRHTLLWKGLTCELLFPLCHLLSVDMNEWMNEWMGQWMKRSRGTCQPCGHLSDRRQWFQSGPSAPFGAASLL